MVTEGLVEAQAVISSNASGNELIERMGLQLDCRLWLWILRCWVRL